MNYDDSPNHMISMEIGLTIDCSGCNKITGNIVSCYYGPFMVGLRIVVIHFFIFSSKRLSIKLLMNNGISIFDDSQNPTILFFDNSSSL